MSSRAVALSLVAVTACAAGGGAPGAGAPRDPAAQVRGRAEPTHRHGDRGATARSPSEPIEVVVCGAAVPEDLAAALDARRAVEAIARVLWEEPQLRVRAIPAGGAGAAGVGPCLEGASSRGFVPDVLVRAAAERDDATERIRRTGNLEAVPTLTVRIEAWSARGGGRATPAASGPVSEALAVVGDAARAARDAILDELAPELPSREFASRDPGRDAHRAATPSALRRLLARR